MHSARPIFIAVAATFAWLSLACSGSGSSTRKTTGTDAKDERPALDSQAAWDGSRVDADERSLADGPTVPSDGTTVTPGNPAADAPAPPRDVWTGPDAPTGFSTDVPVAIEADATADLPELLAETGGSALADAHAEAAAVEADASQPACLAVGQSCASATDCCTGFCDPVTATCMSSVSHCMDPGYPCAVATDCCNLTCTNNRCAVAANCTADNRSCANSSACCSGFCQNGLCQPLNLACKTAGNPCGGDGECCSHRCAGGTCSLAVSYCIQTGDLCYRGADCCTGNCQIRAGRTAGVCAEIVTTGSGSCSKDGTVCQNCTTCCSALCAPFAKTGVKICQPASGCRVTNNLCRQSSDCCGGDPSSGLPGAGNVTCSLADGIDPPLGTCRNPQSCNPQGGICGLKSGATLACTNAREDCCECIPPKWQCCKPDSIGVPRCYGGSTTNCPTGYTGKEPCCLHAGDRCTFSAECCGGAPCVPDSRGVLRCMARPDAGDPLCVASGGACTATFDCCAGLTCNVAPGAPAGICGAPPTVPPVTPPATSDAGSTRDSAGTAPPDAGAAVNPDANPNTDVLSPPVPDAPPAADLPVLICALWGQACSDSLPCCDNVMCGGPGFSGVPCQPGEIGCFCYDAVR